MSLTYHRHEVKLEVTLFVITSSRPGEMEVPVGIEDVTLHIGQAEIDLDNWRRSNNDQTRLANMLTDDHLGSLYEARRKGLKIP